MAPKRPADRGYDGGSEGGTDSPRKTGATEPSRRDLLSTVAAVGTAAGLAGCSDVETGDGFDGGGEDSTEDGTGSEADDPPDAARSVAASPAVLPPAPQRVLGLPEFGVEELTEAVTPSNGGETVAATSYLTVHERPRETDQPVPMQFRITDLAARSFGLLSTPSPERVGATVDPLATEPLVEALAGDRGKQFLQQAGAVGTADFDWVRQPQQVDAREVELLGTATEGVTLLGVAAVGEEHPTTVLANLARVPYEGDVVLVAELVWRQTPPETLDADDACIDESCQLIQEAAAALWEEYRRAIQAARICSSLPDQGTLADACPQPDDDEPPSISLPEGETPTFGVGDVRVVQHVEDTVVKAPGDDPIHEEDDPPPVLGENTAVVFEMDTIENIDGIGGPLTIDVFDRHPPPLSPLYSHEGSFDLTESDLQAIADGEPTLSVLNRISNDGDDNELPVFELGTPDVRLSPRREAHPVIWDTTGVSHTHTIPNVENIDALKVGFVAIKDDGPDFRQVGARYGNANGLPVDFFRTAASGTEYLQRVFPGPVVTYVHEDLALRGSSGAFGKNYAQNSDQKTAHWQLQWMATDPSHPSNRPGFPAGGTLRTDGTSRSRMIQEIRNDGFDVTVAIVPRDYFEFWGEPKVEGEGATSSVQAALVESASPSGEDREVSFNVAHELGHYFQDGYDGPRLHPMAQRNNQSSDANVNSDPVSFLHARHQNSNLDGDDDEDAPGVISTAFDLEDGGFQIVQQWANPNGQFAVCGPEDDCTDDDSTPTPTPKPADRSIPKVPSFMSYTPDRGSAWTDARLHKQLINSGWTFSGAARSDDVRLMVAGTGTVTEDGELVFPEVTAFRGVEEYTHNEDNPVLVELLDPDGDTLVEARVPYEADRIEGTDAGGSADATADESVPTPSFELPFREAGVRVRATYEDETAEFNPVVRSVRDAVGRVPPEGFPDGAEERRDAIGRELDAVRRLVADGADGDAATAMDEGVRNAIERHVVEYEADLGQPTPELLLGLVDEMVRRLEALGGG